MQTTFWTLFNDILKSNISQRIKSRQEYNKQIINKLSYYVDKYPDLRFGQILVIFNFIKTEIDIFYEEPEDTLKHIKDDTSR